MYKHKIYSLEKTECRAVDFLFHIWLLFCCLFGSWFLSYFSCWFHYRHFTTFTFTVVFIGGLINFLLKGFLSFSQFTLLNKKYQHHNHFIKIYLGSIESIFSLFFFFLQFLRSEENGVESLIILLVSKLTAFNGFFIRNLPLPVKSK